MPNSNVWLRGDGAIPLAFEVQYNSIPVSGIVPTVEVIRFADGQQADWSTNTFVPYGTAVSGFASMSGVNGNLGLYNRDFNPISFGENSAQSQTYYSRFRAVVPSGFSDLTVDLSLVTHDIQHFRPGDGELFADFLG